MQHRQHLVWSGKMLKILIFTLECWIRNTGLVYGTWTRLFPVIVGRLRATMYPTERRVFQTKKFFMRFSIIHSIKFCWLRLLTSSEVLRNVGHFGLFCWAYYYKVQTASSFPTLCNFHDWSNAHKLSSTLIKIWTSSKSMRVDESGQELAVKR